MQTILTATDFSETGNNAVNYAAWLALLSKSKLILFHAYHTPLLVSEFPIVTTIEDFPLEEESNEQLSLMVNHIKNRFGGILEVEYLSIAGFASDEITEIAKAKNINLVVIGTHEPEGSDKYFDNNTIDILKHTDFPTLIIPKKWEFKKIDTIVFATDFIKTKNKSILNPLLEIATLFDSKILIYNTEGENIKYSLKEIVHEGIELEETFETLRHSLSLSTNENIADSIMSFAEVNNAGIIVMIKRHHNFLHRLFSESNTEQMALKTKVPLLILRENTINNH